MLQQTKDVEEFHRRLGFYVGDKPAHPPRAERWHRADLIDEEVIELLDELKDPTATLEAIAQEGVDVLYVINGMFVEYGIDPKPIFDAIHAANMTKIPNPHGGKAIKPEGWTKPDLRPMIEKQRK